MENEVGGTCGMERKVCKVLVIKLKGKRRLGRPKRRWEDEIRTVVRETGSGAGLVLVGLG
jgi:hypothetical protein